MNLKHTLYVIADAKALCSALYSSGNIQIKGCWKPVDPLSYIIVIRNGKIVLKYMPNGPFYAVMLKTILY